MPSNNVFWTIENSRTNLDDIELKDEPLEEIDPDKSLFQKGNLAKNITGSNKTNALLNVFPSVPLVNGKSKLINDRTLDYGNALQTKDSASSKDDIIPVATVKDNVKKFICNHCGFQADYNIDLKQHIKEKHPLTSSPKKKKLFPKPILSLTYDKESDNSSQVKKETHLIYFN